MVPFYIGHETGEEKPAELLEIEQIGNPNSHKQRGAGGLSELTCLLNGCIPRGGGARARAARSLSAAEILIFPLSCGFHSKVSQTNYASPHRCSERGKSPVVAGVSGLADTVDSGSRFIHGKISFVSNPGSLKSVLGLIS